MSDERKVKCRECRCVDAERAVCKLTGRQVTLDSERNCKRYGSRE